MKRLLVATIGLSFLLRAFSQDFETIESPREVGIENTTKDNRLHFSFSNDCPAEVSLSLATNKPPKVGGPIEIEYVIQSLPAGATNRQFFFVDTGRLVDLGVIVFNDQWKVLPSKVEYPEKPLEFPQEYNPIRRVFHPLSNEPWKSKFDLNKYCDTAAPGKYWVMVVCPIVNFDHMPTCEIASKPLAITILRGP